MKKRLARFVLRLGGWSIKGDRPKYKRYVLIAAPHTSNWDFFLMLLFAAALDVKVTWMGKHSLFRPPLGWIMRGFGGMPIRRHENNDVVQQMVEAFRNSHELILAIPAEGTRESADYWKSGFYHIARQARVPVTPSFLDWGRKVGGLGAAYQLTGDVREDMDHFRHFYAGVTGRFPEKFGPIRLREEDQPDP
jgi:1-acyl-sn-glycerol-3-phosphate acyltransferase